METYPASAITVFQNLQLGLFLVVYVYDADANTNDDDDDVTVVSRRSELNRSSQVAAAFRKASCRRISCSTSSTLPPSSLLLMNGS